MFKYLNKNYKNIEELKKHYRELMKKYHPDINPNGTKITQIINDEFEKLFNILKIKANNSTNTKNHTTETPEQFINIINKIITFEDLIIEIVGSWIWLSGNTYPYKKTFKELGFRWSKGRKKWYLGELKGSSKYYKKESWEEITNKYNYNKIQTHKVYAIA